MTTTHDPTRTTGDTAKQAFPALVIGVGSALALIGISELADQLEHFLWDWLPDSFGTTGENRWWIFGMLTVVGLAVGLVVWLAPGHAGPDPATTGLVSAPLPLWVLPGLAVALVICLAGGTSLGPENPIIAINVGLAVWLLSRWLPNVPGAFGTVLAISGTVGAMFGTPVAAALLLTEMKEFHQRGSLWDNLFAPLVAAGSGGLTMYLLESPTLSVSVPKMGTPGWDDLLSGLVIAVIATLVTLVGLYAYNPLHKLFRLLPHPVFIFLAGGLVLGMLGAIGGEITLFKGLEQMKELTDTAGDYTVGGLILIALVKLGAMVVAATAGFRGGRIFPSVFIGLAIGQVAHAIDNDIPLALAIACGILGVVLVVSRDGWLSLFMAVAIVGDANVLPLLCLIILPVWLIVSARPEMIATPTEPAENQPPRQSA
ncbi:ion channel protein [Aldersonia sp. NBC_00410]|uniref:ion channel protein n=1 Tax=Aldersonia sp. NBC_00410 TaxID=2975954 RepID=UPI0022514041|nr:ion channel protein [Aldersonia sp. NBC_00410]MCX5043415.1 ion channel protein [Aldersonia sp. NBC_00410]